MAKSKVGVIGYKGFVGSAFFEAFSSDKNYSVVGIDRANYAKLKGNAFHILINCNGNSSKRLADTNPQADFEANVSATARFLFDFPCEHYIHISTVEVYGDKTNQETTHEGAAINPSLLSNYGYSKYLGEQIAARAKSYLIVRLGGMVGRNMKKGPAYDILHMHKLFISEKSCYQFISTSDVANIAKLLCEKGKWGEIYNVVGSGSIELAEFAKIAKVKLAQTGKEVQIFNVSTDKLGKEAAIPTTLQAVKDFIKTSG